ncbi:Gfo/Idh/MocA family protein [Halomarina halobia]|uniref:Gfo/Idh/MocA family protein n=1 Tax=Halomarina halobia TaxID=3033386 RepID=A0ABD6AF16_9EURY|nr:Gfo/Idh/MocA family oxidoreductase [Halomarina sp. PSR21]
MDFGVLGTATIARQRFIPAVADTDHAVRAIASRTEERAAAVAAEHDVPHAYGSYDALLRDEVVDAVYVPLPNSEHARWIRRAADQGLHALCEKPLGVTAEEARDVGAYCAERDVTLMEALMYRYAPRTERVIELVGEELGEIRSATATFHSELRGLPTGIRFDPALGGGSLLDVGVYAVDAVRLSLGTPDRVYAHAMDSHDTGVDTQATALFEYDANATATVSSSFDTAESQYYHVIGTDGWVTAEPAFSSPDANTSIDYERAGRRITETFPPHNPYRREVEHFVSCIEEGRTPRTNATEAARTLAILDAIRESAETNAVVAVE